MSPCRFCFMKFLFSRMVQHGRLLCGLLLWILTLYMNEGECQIVCPRVVELYSTTFLTCKVSSGSRVIYVTPGGNTAATCISNRPLCISRYEFVRFNGTVLNSTQSYLQIKDVQKSDEGTWVCEDQKSKIESTCNLVTSDTPSCNITSYKNMEELHVGDNLSLSVHIDDYYCSRPAGFHLETGNTTIELTRIKGNVLNATFILTDSNFGSVKLLFECNNVTKVVSCGNVENLVKRENLQSDKDDKQIVIIAVYVVAVIITVVILIPCIVKRIEIMKWLIRLLAHSKTKDPMTFKNTQRSVKDNSNPVTHDSETGFVTSVGDSKMVAGVNCASKKGEGKGGLNLASTGLPESQPMLKA